MIFASLSTACAAESPAKAEPAQGLTGTKFLTWERENKEFYIGVSVGMASLIAAQNDKKQAQCIDDWYKSDPRTPDDYILDIMQQYPEYHPRGVILGVLQKKCGKFAYKN